jgi:hypothetical protein
MEVNNGAQKEASVVEALDYNSFCKLLLKLRTEDGEKTPIFYFTEINFKNCYQHTNIYVCSLTYFTKNYLVQIQPGLTWKPIGQCFLRDFYPI